MQIWTKNKHFDDAYEPSGIQRAIKDAKANTTQNLSHRKREYAEQ